MTLHQFIKHSNLLNSSLTEKETHTTKTDQSEVMRKYSKRKEYKESNLEEQIF